MLALREFVTFVTHHKANLAETYANLLAERGDGYEQISKESRIATARKEIKSLEYFDYVVINAEDRIEETCQSIVSIITAEKSRVHPREIEL